MEFAAPEQSHTLMTIFAIGGILFGLIFSLILGEGVIFGIGVTLVFGSFGVLGGDLFGGGAYQDKVYDIISQQNPNLVLSEKSDIPIKEDKVEEISFITNDGGVFSCSILLKNDRYRISCEGPSAEGRGLTIDQAVNALNKN